MKRGQIMTENVMQTQEVSVAQALHEARKKHPLTDFEINNFGWKLSQIVKMINNGRLSLEYPLQREKGVWSLESKQLLIDSIIVGIPIVPAFVVSKALTDEMLEEIENNAQERISHLEKQKNDENADEITQKQELIQKDFDKLEAEYHKKQAQGEDVEIRYIIDGLQRISTFYDFLENKFAMPEDAPIYVNEDGDEIDLAGKYFSELDMETQMKIATWNLRIFSLNSKNVPDEIIEMLFIRLNNGTPLKHDQKLKSVFGLKLAPKLLEYAEHPFIKNTALSKGSIKSDAHLSAIVMTMMFDKEVNTDQNFTDYSIKAILEYAKELRDTLSIEELEALFDEQTRKLDFANDILEGRKTSFIKRAIIPLVVTLFDTAEKEGIGRGVIAEWFYKFVEEIEADVEYEHPYNKYRNKGTTKPHIMLHKYEIMKKDLFAYQEKM